MRIYNIPILNFYNNLRLSILGKNNLALHSCQRKYLCHLSLAAIILLSQELYERRYIKKWFLRLILEGNYCDFYMKNKNKHIKL